MDEDEVLVNAYHSPYLKLFREAIKTAVFHCQQSGKKVETESSNFPKNEKTNQLFPWNSPSTTTLTMSDSISFFEEPIRISPSQGSLK